MDVKQRYVIQDCMEIRTNLRKFMRMSKHSKRFNDKIASTRFLKEVKREIDDYLRARGYLRKGN